MKRGGWLRRKTAWTIVLTIAAGAAWVWLFVMDWRVGLCVIVVMWQNNYENAKRFVERKDPQLGRLIKRYRDQVLPR